MTMGPERAEKHGYSWALLRGGIDGWPWRQMPTGLAEEMEIRRAIYAPRQLSDRQLRNLGIARSGIESAVRHGHPDRGFNFDDRDRAA